MPTIRGRIIEMGAGNVTPRQNRRALRAAARTFAAAAMLVALRGRGSARWSWVPLAIAAVMTEGRTTNP